MAYHLSIIIPHFNSPILLAKLLDSIPEKEDIQIIVVDDSSTKHLQEYQSVTEKYAHRVEFYRNTSGVQSAGACRNIGLENAKGTWLLFADADDYYLPSMYETVSRYFQSDYDRVIFCPTSVVLETGETSDRHCLAEMRIRQYLAESTHENLMNVKKMKGAWSTLFRRSVIEENHIRFSETLHHNDMYFVFQASCFCEKTAVSGEVIYCLTRNRGSLTTKFTERAFDLHVQEYIKCYRFGIEHYSKEDFALCNMNGGNLLFEAYKRKLGFKKILKTYRLFRKNHIPLFSKAMRNPRYLLKAVLHSNKMLNQKQKFNTAKKSSSSEIMAKRHKRLALQKRFPWAYDIYRHCKNVRLIRRADRLEKLPESEYPALLSKAYEKNMKCVMDWYHPQKYTEKMQWAKLYDKNPQKPVLADKYRVRDWVKEKIGEEYLIPLLGCWDSFDEIDFDALPDSFVLKANHGSGMNVIVKNKQETNLKRIKWLFNDWMRMNYAFTHDFQLHYATIPRKIIAEKYIESKQGDLQDYKFLCFDGIPYFCWVDYGRFGKHTRLIFDMNWNVQSWTISYKKSDEVMPKPENFEKMVEIARILAEGFPHVRVDLYNVDGQIYFGEMTFTCGNGFSAIEPEEYDYKLGSYWNLPIDGGEC